MFDAPDTDNRLSEALDAAVELLLKQENEIAALKDCQKRQQRLMAEFDRRLMDAETRASHVLALEQRLRAVELQNPPKLVDGKFPPKAKTTGMRCQMFHTPDLSAKDRKTKSEWSLRFTVGMCGQWVKPEINMRLFDPDQFYDVVRARSDAPDDLKAAAKAMRGMVGANVLGGILQAKPSGRGRPYVPCQFVIAMCDDREPEVRLHVDGEVFDFVRWRPGAGTAAGQAKWFSEWTP